MTAIRVLGRDEGDVLSNVAPDGGQIVGMASAVQYVNPDKPPELWINEVGVAPTHQGQGIGRRLVAALVQHGRSLGCVQAWVLTDASNEPAQRMYRAAGGEASDQPAIMFTFRIRDRA